MSLLSCSKCFIPQMLKKKKKKKIQERVDKVFVDLFLSCKEPNRQKLNLQSCNMRRCRNQSEEAGPSCSGSLRATVIKCTPKCIQQRLSLVGVPSEIEIGLCHLKFQKAKYYFYKY